MFRTFIIALCAVVLRADVGLGTISVNWESGQLTEHGMPGTPIPDNALALLLWSPDNVMDPIDPFQPGAATGNDTVLYAAAPGELVSGFILVGAPLTFLGENNPGTPPVSTLAPPGTYNIPDGLVGGWVFTRVFNVPNPGVGDWYAEGGLVFMQDQDPAAGSGPGPQTVNITGSLGTPMELSTQVIPEPKKAAFMVLALAFLGVCRLRRAASVP